MNEGPVNQASLELMEQGERRHSFFEALVRRGTLITVIVGVIDHPSVAAGTIAAVAVDQVMAGRVEPGARGLASWPEPNAVLESLWHRGVRVAAFDGALDPSASDHS